MKKKSSMKKLFVSIFLVMAMVFSMGNGVLAADLDELDITMKSGSTPFTQEQVDVYNPDEGVNYPAYSLTGQLPAGTNLNSVPVEIGFEGTELKIDGTTVATASPYTGTINFNNISHEIEVVGASESRVYHTAAYITGTQISTDITLDYSNLKTFANLPIGAIYGNSGYVDPVDSTQKTLAGNGVTALNNKNAEDTINYSVNAGESAIDILTKYYKITKSLDIDYSASYVSAIEKVDMNSSGMFYGFGTGGWMYSVTRGGQTFYPSIAASLWKLQPGDVITWSYTCDWGDDLGYPMM